MNRPVLAFLALPLGAVCVACNEEIPRKQPTPPDMSELIETYQNPTADFTREVAQGFLEQAFGDLKATYESDIFGNLLGVVGDSFNAEDGEQKALRVQGEAHGEPIAGLKQGLSFGGEGFLKITRVCQGWEDNAPIDPDANGQLELTSNFGDKGIEPIIWGDAASCKYKVPLPEDSSVTQRVAFDGFVRLYLGEHLNPASLDEFGQRPILFQIGGLELPDADFDEEGAVGASFPNFNFRFLPEISGFEFQVDRAERHMLVGLSQKEDEGFVFSVRASNGNFTCDLEQLTCTNEDTDQTFDFNFNYERFQ
jgi:hypothetical protein